MHRRWSSRPRKVPNACRNMRLWFVEPTFYRRVHVTNYLFLSHTCTFYPRKTEETILQQYEPKYVPLFLPTVIISALAELRGGAVPHWKASNLCDIAGVFGARFLFKFKFIFVSYYRYRVTTIRRHDSGSFCRVNHRESLSRYSDTSDGRKT